MSEPEPSTFEKVREIVAEVTRTDPSRISMETDLARDLGIAGDDGEELFLAFDRSFDVDWKDLNLCVHFGPELSVPPLPWNLEQDSGLFETQPCRIAQVVEAVDTGVWPGTKLVPLSAPRRAWSMAMSIAYWSVPGLILAMVALALVLQLFD